MTKSIDIYDGIRKELRCEAEAQGNTCPPIVYGPVLGPRDGGYKIDNLMTPEEAEAFHDPLIKLLASDHRVDFIGSGSIADVNEAIGIAKSCKRHDIPLCIRFTLNKDDCTIKSGQSLKVRINKGMSGSVPSSYSFQFECTFRMPKTTTFSNLLL